MTTVKLILDNKGYEFFSINPDATVFEALGIMADKNIGALMVIDGDGKLVGMFSERDYARKIILHGVKSKEASIVDYMSTELHTVNPDTSVLGCMAVMTDKKVRHVPVLDHNKLVGIISIGDVVNTIIEDQKATIQDLEKYITASGYGHQ
ncbi:MAG TPA: CBS domain-containing protein [Bacteroides sp.]|nr:CBS domain-containing protein [Bacteroides sp.]